MGEFETLAEVERKKIRALYPRYVRVDKMACPKHNGAFVQLTNSGKVSFACGCIKQVDMSRFSMATFAIEIERR